VKINCLCAARNSSQAPIGELERLLRKKLIVRNLFLPNAAIQLNESINGKQSILLPRSIRSQGVGISSAVNTKLKKNAGGVSTKPHP